MKLSENLMDLLKQQLENDVLADETESLREQVDAIDDCGGLETIEKIRLLTQIDTNMLRLNTHMSKVVTEFCNCCLPTKH